MHLKITDVIGAVKKFLETPTVFLLVPNRQRYYVQTPRETYSLLTLSGSRAGWVKL